MPEITEAELSEGWEKQSCTQCPDFEGAIWLCGEGMICERCFAKLAGIDESELFKDDDPILDFEVPKEYTARAQANLMMQRSQDAEGQV